MVQREYKWSLIVNKYYFASAALLAASTVPVAANAEVFNGPFIGLQAGWDRHKIGAADSDLGDLAVRNDNDDVVGGIIAGYDYKIAPRIVIGAEGNFNLGASDKINGRGPSSNISIDPRHSFGITARAGFLVTDDTLVYVRGGYDNLNVRSSVRGATETLSNTETFDGWIAGGGVERALNEKVSARVEYRYSDVSGGHGKFEQHQALLGVAYHF